MRSDRVRRYFESTYPSRGALLGRVVFRRGEQGRRSTLRQWLQDEGGAELLDVACGDGVVLDAILPPTVRLVRIQDLVPANLLTASRHLRRPGRTVHAAAVDVNLPADDRKFDIVVAIGVLDYNPRWETIVSQLWCRARHVLIVDFPRARTCHSLVRAGWLRLQGMRLRTATEGELMQVLASLPGRATVRRLEENWLVRIDKGVSAHPS